MNLFGKIGVFFLGLGSELSGTKIRHPSVAGERADLSMKR